MAKVSIPQLLAGAAQIYTGSLQGKQLARQQNADEEARRFHQDLQQKQFQAQQQERELSWLFQGLERAEDDETAGRLGALLDARLNLLGPPSTNPGAPPPGRGTSPPLPGNNGLAVTPATSPLSRAVPPTLGAPNLHAPGATAATPNGAGIPNPGQAGIPGLTAGVQGALAAKTAATPAPPLVPAKETPTTGKPTRPPFQGAQTRAALRLLGAQAAQLWEEARKTGDPEAMQRISEYRQALAAGKLPLLEAGAQFGQLQQGLGAAVATTRRLKRIEEVLTEWNDRIAPQYRDQANDLAGRMATADLSTAAGREAAAAMEREFAAFRAQPGFMLSAAEVKRSQAESEADTRAFDAAYKTGLESTGDPAIAAQLGDAAVTARRAARSKPVVTAAPAATLAAPPTPQSVLPPDAPLQDALAEHAAPPEPRTAITDAPPTIRTPQMAAIEASDAAAENSRLSADERRQLLPLKVDDLKGQIADRTARQRVAVWNAKLRQRGISNDEQAQARRELAEATRIAQADRDAAQRQEHHQATIGQQQATELLADIRKARDEQATISARQRQIVASIRKLRPDAEGAAETKAALEEENRLAGERLKILGDYVQEAGVSLKTLRAKQPPPMRPPAAAAPTDPRAAALDAITRFEAIKGSPATPKERNNISRAARARLGVR